MTFAEIIQSGEYSHYGIRAHRTEATVGAYLGKSHVWVDGECTDETLNGISAIRVTPETVDQVVALIRSTYCWDAEQIVLVGGFEREHGEDDGEIIIRDNVCLGVL